MYRLKIEIKSINDDKLNLIIESYNMDKMSVERKMHIKSILIQELFINFNINNIGDITSSMIREMIGHYNNRIKKTNKLTESDKWNSLYEHIEMLKDIARDLYLDIN